MKIGEGPWAGYNSLVSSGTLARDTGQELAVDKLQILHRNLAGYNLENPLFSWKSLFSFRSTNKESYPKGLYIFCLLYTSPSPRDGIGSRMPSSA